MDVPHHRQFFYVGGEYIESPSGHLLCNQMYVERLLPLDGSTQPFPIIFVHGNGQSGSNWLNKPDGGMGWASWFLNHGYEVYIIDQPNTGRSPCHPAIAASKKYQLVSFTAEVIQERFTAPAKYKLWPQAQLHTQWPGTGTIGDPVFDAYFSSILPTPTNSVEQERVLRGAGIALLEKIGRPAIVVTHSQGGLAGWSWTDARPTLVKALVQVEPKGPPFREALFSTTVTRPWGLTAIPLSCDPPTNSDDNGLSIGAAAALNPLGLLQKEPARKLVNLGKIPILIVTAEASYHAMYDDCFHEFLVQAGCQKVQHLKLGEAGLYGNGHLMFMERNSGTIAEKIEEWISRTVLNHSQNSLMS